LVFAQFGHRVVASDLSRAAVARAKIEAELRGLDISFFVSDMTTLTEIAKTDFDVVTVLDNALPHLTSAQIGEAARAIGSKLKPKGLFIASIRDYDHSLFKTGYARACLLRHRGRTPGRSSVWEWIDTKST